MGIAASIKSNRMTGGQREYFKEGDHRCRVDSVMLGKTPLSNVEIFAVELNIQTTTSQEKSMQPGRTINSATLRQGNQAKVYFGNIKSFLGGLYGFSEDDIDAMPDEELDECIELLTGKAQSATGLLIDAICVPRTKDGKVFPKWKHVPDEEQPLLIKKKEAEAAQAAA